MLLLHISPLLAPRRVGPIARQRFATQARRTASHGSRILRYTALGAVGLSAGAFLRPTLQFEPSRPSSPVTAPAPPAPVPTPPPAATAIDDDKPLPPPPVSSLAPMELSFGLVCGLCTGVFVKKGAKAIAFAVGGMFVLLQYLSINSFVRVDWQRMGSRFEHLFYRVDPVTGKTKPPTLGSLWNWLVNFLTTDFQPRASFLAGLALGIRLG